MFGFLKKFSKKSEPVAPIVPVAEPPPVFASVSSPEPEYAPAPEPAPVQRPVPVQRTVAPRVPVAPQRAPIPARVAPVVAPVPAPAHVPRVAPVARQAVVMEPPVYEFTSQQAEIVPATPSFCDEIVALPLKKLWHKLNPAVVQGAAEHPNGDSFLQLPLSYLHSQLAKGSVKIPFPDFCNFAPQGLFTSAQSSSVSEVDIPVSDILPLLKPGHLDRRPNQRKIHVPDDIGPIFGPDGAPAHGLRVAETKARAQKPATPPASAPAPAATHTPVAPLAFHTAPEKIPATSLPPAPSRINTPITPITPSAPITPIAPPSSPILPISPIASSPNELPEPSLSDRIPAPRLDPSLASLKPKAPQANVSAPVPSAPLAPTVSGPAAQTNQPESFILALMDVAAFWSEKGRNDLANLYRHSLEIPMSTLESALKSGKLTFQWREIRPWLRLAPGNTMPTLQDDLSIELPLSIVAPRFVEQRSHGKPKRRFDVGEDIGDVFEQKALPPGHVAPATPSTPPLAATAVPMNLASSLAASSATGDTAFLTRSGGKTLLEFGEIFGQPEKKNWSLAEVAQKTMSLRGVAGAIIASGDGLLIAGTWPNGVKGDAVSAFLPQLYGRILQYTKELKLGEPGHVTLMIENVPLQIFKAGTSYFTVIGRAGENLPKAQLNAIATRLSTNFSGK